MPVTIENPQSLTFKSHEERVLKTMFADYQRLVVRSRLAGGFSGSQVYLVRPVRDTGPELPAVVKIDLYERIEQEWQAFTSCIQYRLPNVAEIRGQPVNPSGCPLSGLWYPLAGAGLDDIDSLHNYFLKTPAEKIAPFLETRLFKRFFTLWQQAVVHPDFNFRAVYDDFLPINLTIDCTEPKAGFEVHWVDPDSFDKRQWAVGEYVQVSGFKVVKLLRDKQGLSLDAPQSHRAFRIHVYGVGDASEFELEQIIQRPFTGIIKETRQRQLLKLAQSALGSEMDLQPTVLSLSDGRTLPNPLTNWSTILSRVMDVRMACIHGDLNMENVLVDMDTETVHLIDFAKSGRGHVLRDLLHLEMTVVNKILSVFMTDGETAAAVIGDLYGRLHCVLTQSKPIGPPPNLEKVFTILLTIRRAAQTHIFQTGSWKEYYTGLFIYLLGSLRFPDLDKMDNAPLPKQLAFWGSAVILDLMVNEPDCSVFQTAEKPQQKRVPNPDPAQPQAAVSSWDIDKIIADWQAAPLPQRLILFKMLKSNFSMNDLGELAFSVGLDLDDLPSSGKSGKAQELIGYFERRGNIRKLIEAVHNVRPTIPWS